MLVRSEVLVGAMEGVEDEFALGCWGAGGEAIICSIGGGEGRCEGEGC